MGCLKPNSMPYETSRGTNNAVKGHTRSPLDPLRTPNVPSKPPKTQHYPASCPITLWYSQNDQMSTEILKIAQYSLPPAGAPFPL